MNQDDLSLESPEARSTSIENPEYSDDGVDLTLIRWMLSMPPAERLQVLQEAVRSLTRLRNGSFFS
jgi:hypothetical protein